jgi:hypothetical protein
VNLSAFTWKFGHFEPQHRFLVPKNCTILLYCHPLGEASDIVKAEGTGEDPRATGCLIWQTRYEIQFQNESSPISKRGDVRFQKRKRIKLKRKRRPSDCRIILLPPPVAPRARCVDVYVRMSARSVPSSSDHCHLTSFKFTQSFTRPYSSYLCCARPMHPLSISSFSFLCISYSICWSFSFF